MKMMFAAVMLAAAACGQQTVATGNSAIELSGRVVDRANIIDSATETKLEQQLSALEGRTTDQLVVVTVPTLDGQRIEDYTRTLANRWRIGREDWNNGVVLLVAPQERKGTTGGRLWPRGAINRCSVRGNRQDDAAAVRKTSLFGGHPFGHDGG